MVQVGNPSGAVPVDALMRRCRLTPGSVHRCPEGVKVADRNGSKATNRTRVAVGCRGRARGGPADGDPRARGPAAPASPAGARRPRSVWDGKPLGTGRESVLRLGRYAFRALGPVSAPRPGTGSDASSADATGIRASSAGTGVRRAHAAATSDPAPSHCGGPRTGVDALDRPSPGRAHVCRSPIAGSGLQWVSRSASARTAEPVPRPNRGGSRGPAVPHAPAPN